MSKNLSLDIKTTYQMGLGVVILFSLIIGIFDGINAFALFSKPAKEPVIKIREQQLQQAINLLQPKSPEN